MVEFLKYFVLKSICSSVAFLHFIVYTDRRSQIRWIRMNSEVLFLAKKCQKVHKKYQLSNIILENKVYLQIDPKVQVGRHVVRF